MKSPFYSYLETMYRIHLLEDKFTKAEWAALGRFENTNRLGDLPESVISKLRKMVVKDNLDSSEFDNRLHRFYTAINLQTYADRVKDRFNIRSWDAWTSEKRSMSDDKITLFYNLTGVEVGERPKIVVDAPVGGGKTTVVPASKSLVESRLEFLQNDLKSEEFRGLVSAYVETVDIDKNANDIALHHGADYVEMMVEDSQVHGYKLYVNGGFKDSYETSEEIVTVALDEMKTIVQEKLRKMPAKKSAPKSKVPHGREAETKLIRELKNTDTDAFPNFKRWQKTPEGIKFFDEVDAFRFYIRINEQNQFPYLVMDADGAGDQVFSDPVDAIKFVVRLLLAEDDEMAEPDDIEATVQAILYGTFGESKKKTGKKMVRELLDDDDDENKVVSLFNAHSLARCPALAKFDELRQDYFDEANGDRDNVSSLFDELEVIAMHSFTRVMAEYWTESFQFVLQEDMEEAPEYKLVCADFTLTVYPTEIRVDEIQNEEDVLSYTRITGQLSLHARLDMALNYFATWGEKRTRDTLERIGFSLGPFSDDEKPENLHSEQSKIEVLDYHADPRLFFVSTGVVEDTALSQIHNGGDGYMLLEFLRDEVSNVRGVIFNETDENQGVYGLTLFADRELRLHSVSARNSGPIVLVAESDSAEYFMDAVESGEDFTLDDLCNKGMIVETSHERTTLKFNHDSSAYVVHIFE